MYTNSPTHRRAPRGTLTRVCAVALLTCAAMTPLVPASAGPDDGRIITTQSHVDAPKTYWENGTFTLKNESDPYNTGPSRYDLDKTVNWVGQGWDGRNGASQYTLTLNDSPNLRFLGKPGQTLYMAPALTWGNHNPIWAGLGSSVKIPTEQFRDGIYATDILSVDGPGRMELFSYNPEDAPADVNRILSSTSTGWHSWLLSKGSHTHNITTFTRPGRYVITYRTVARGTDGRIIQSAPQRMTWQVGGQKPILGDGTPTAVPTVDRYNAANVGDLGAAHYTLTVAPHQLDPDPAKNKDADDKLSDITFTAGDKSLKGKLTLYNNGYFLTDLDVKNGAAIWREMMGGEASHLQAVFTPEGGSGSRWISPQLAYEPGKSASVHSQDGNGTWPVPQPEARNTTLSTGQHTLTSGDYTAQVVPAGKPGYRTLEIRFADPAFRGFIRGGFYVPHDYEYPTFDVETTVEDGVARFTYLEDSDLDHRELIVKVLPHPDMNATASQVTLTRDYQRESDYRVTGKLGTDLPAADAPAAPDQPAPKQPAPEKPAASQTPQPSQPAATPSLSGTQPAAAATGGPTAGAAPSNTPGTPQTPAPNPMCEPGKISGRHKIGDGHLDLQANLHGNSLELGLKDDSGIIDSDSVVRPVDTVVWTVSDRARRSRNERMNSPKLDFIGPVGTAFYGLPQTQMRGLPWPGYSTENVDYSRLDGGVTLHVVPRSMPKGAQFGMFTESLTGPEVLLDSTKNRTSVSIDYATHAHANWVFTEPGQYMFDVQYSAKLKDGTEVRSKVQQLAVAVGDEASNACSFEGSAAGSQAKAGSPAGQHAPGDTASGSSAETGSRDASAQSTDAQSKNTQGTDAQGAGAGVQEPLGTEAAGVSEDAGASSGEGAVGGADTDTSGAVQGAGSTQEGSGDLAQTGFAAAGAAAVGVVLLGLGIFLRTRRSKA